MNISVLRSIFDKIGGMSATSSLITPKRPEHLPEILTENEVMQILSAATTTRDQLLLGLIYDCGLKVSEVCSLKWNDINAEQNTLTVRYARNTKERQLSFSADLQPVLKMGKSRCDNNDYIFQGRIKGTHLSTRMAEIILRKAKQATDIIKTVTCMTLRHSFAVHSMENGDSVRALQEALGHKSISTTLLYQQCILPAEAKSPLDLQRQKERNQESTEKKKTLFKQPPTVAALELPFRSPKTDIKQQAINFYKLLKTQIFGRFLGIRSG